MCSPDGDPIGKPRVIHRQASFDSVVLMRNDGVIRGLPIDGDQGKPEKKNELTIIRCFLKTVTITVGLITQHSPKLAYRQTLMGRDHCLLNQIKTVYWEML